MAGVLLLFVAILLMLCGTSLPHIFSAGSAEKTDKSLARSGQLTRPGRNRFLLFGPRKLRQ
jgi:hypothetical protein